jgi:hypothetical protein
MVCSPYGSVETFIFHDSLEMNGAEPDHEGGSGNGTD